MDASQRRDFIGGSDAGVILGVNAYTSPYQLWLEKTGQSERIEAENHSTAWGRRLEPVVGEAYAERTGRGLVRHPEMLVHPEYPMLGAHIDFAVAGKEVGLECKTASAFAANQWGDDGARSPDAVPPSYYAQIQHYLAVTGWAVWDIAVLIGGNDLRVYSYERDDEFIEGLIAEELAFWECIQRREPPALRTLMDARLAYPLADPGKTLAADDALRGTVAELRNLREQVRALEEREEALKTTLMLALGERERLVDGGATLVTWKNQSRSRVDLAALRAQHPQLALELTLTEQSRVLRIK
ncbi:MAG: YqaJ viral recombinase family nuclease [Vulcanimicrobiaceae bacterium]